MKNTTKLLLFAVVLFAFSCGEATETATETETTSAHEATENPRENVGGGQSHVKAGEGEQLNVLQTALTVPDLSTLVVAVQKAGVEDALSNAGPLTVFAPLNSAFDKLPEGTVATLIKPENKETLGMILKNHVAPSNYPIKQLKKEAKKGRKLYMASGKYLVVENKDGKIFVGGTEVLKSVKVSNGWVHVINDVLVPVEE